MAAPTDEIVQMRYQNPHASSPLYVPVLVVCNTSDEDLERNIRHNSALNRPWIAAAEPHDGVAVMVGGGASVAEHLDEIASLRGTIFAMNAASRYLRGNGIPVDYQVICDAKPETASLVDPAAQAHLFASQVHPDTMAKVPAKVWHLEIGNIEAFFPEARRKRGGYALLGGGASVGNSALCLAYAMGFRTFYIFGYDSCHRGERSHAYDQPMNRFIPTVDVEWGGRIFHASVAMKAQAEKFQVTGQALQQAGCTLHVRGDGLLQAMWNTPRDSLPERDKYRLLWQFDGYRDYSPGEEAVETFLAQVKPDGLVIDFGCGTGRASVKLAKAGLDVFLIDFADNCRDAEAQALPFLEWDLSKPIPVSAPYGICADVMEHIPTDQVDTVLANIMASAGTVFFQIATREDEMGAVVHQTLHHTVQPHEWWAGVLGRHGRIVSDEIAPGVSRFILQRALSERTI